MPDLRLIKLLGAAALIAALAAPAQVVAQSAEADTPAEDNGETSDTLFAPDELQELVAPVALYPDTLLVQVLVAATLPLEVVKADQFVKANADAEPDALKTDIEAQGWDPSVTVLATAFPSVLSNMSEHIDWTETMGTAMLAQNEDVMEAVQVMRSQAEDAGTLESTAEQTVEVTQEDNGDETIIIQPADPQVVYVPQYNTETVYVPQETTETTTSSGSNDALTSAIIFFGTAILINEIFDDDDDYYNYWGCRNCGGWYGRPIIRDPGDVNIDIDGNVNIGNDVDIGWRPDDRDRDRAQERISNGRENGRASVMPARAPTQSDQLRRDLTNRTGAADISRPEAQQELNRAIQSADRPANGRLPEASQKTLDRTKRDATPQAPARTPQAKPSRPAVQAPARQSRPTGGGALRQQAPAARAKAGGNRGRSAKNRAGRGR